MRGTRSPWLLFLVAFLLTFAADNLAVSEDGSQKNLQPAVVVGSVYCDTCFQQDGPKSIHFIPGASVAVECKQRAESRPSFREEAKTNEHGEFKVVLPFSVSKHVRKIRDCSVRLISSSEPYCSIASAATSSSLHLKLRKEGAHIFSAGFFTFKPLKQPELCNQKPRNKLNFDKSDLSMDDIAFPPVQDPQSNPMFPNLPPLPFLPKLPSLPQLPPLPPLPALPTLPPFPGKSTQTKPQEITDSNVPSADGLSDKKTFFPIGPSIFPPNPFLQTPVLPPNPFQPPLSIFPPNPLVSPASPFIRSPTVPGLNPPAIPSPSSPFPGFPPTTTP